MSKKVLVADDSPTIRNVAESLLKKHGYEVLLADDGVKALRIAKLEKPEIIFLDLSLPLLNGEEVLREIKQSDALRNIPVIMLLSQDEVGRKHKLESLGVETFIVNPFSPKEILDQVDRLLRKKQESLVEEKVEAISSTKKGRLKNGLDILETSDLMEDFDRSIPLSEKAGAHGFDWFLSELRKEIQEEEKPELHPGKEALLGEKKIPDRAKGKIPTVSPPKSTGEKEQMNNNQIQEDDIHEDFLEDLRRELDQADEEETESKPPATEHISPSQFDRLLSDIREKISERVAQEVTKTITPEFLEKIIREVIAHPKEHSR